MTDDYKTEHVSRDKECVAAIFSEQDLYDLEYALIVSVGIAGVPELRRRLQSLQAGLLKLRKEAFDE